MLRWSIACAILVISVIGSIWIRPHFDSAFAGLSNSRDFPSLLQALGAALIGAAALAFTLIMFAMQVNVERLPHGLFRRLSSDSQLLAYFATTLLVALGLTLSSLAASYLSVGHVVLMAVWACLIVAILLALAYRRALLLTSPWDQLQLMIAYTERALRKPIRRANMLRPLLPPIPENTDSVWGPSPLFDTARATVFKLFPNWDTEAHRSLSIAVSFATRSAAVGDYETSGESLNTVVRLNSCY